VSHLSDVLGWLLCDIARCKTAQADMTRDGDCFCADAYLGRRGV
jgi:hypothetical protein